MSTVLILQQPEWSSPCKVLQSPLGTAAVPAGKPHWHPNLNLIILFQQVFGDCPPPCFPEGSAISFPAPDPGWAQPWAAHQTQWEKWQRSTSRWHALSRVGLCNAATSSLGQKGHKRTLIPHLTTVGHVSWVAHPKEMLSAAKESSYVVASGGWAWYASLEMWPSQMGSPGMAGSSQAAPLLVPDLPDCGVPGQFGCVAEPEISSFTFLAHYHLHCTSVIPPWLM